jgi:hypothetical protein
VRECEAVTLPDSNPGGRPLEFAALEDLDCDELRAERDRARHIAIHLFQMVDREAWRAQGAEWMGQYEGDHWAAELEQEIRSWA